MFRLWLGALSAIALSLPATAQVQPYPANFRTQEIQTNSTTLHVRVGGQGPAVVLLHAMAGPATCGRRWPRSSPATTPSSPPTCAAWGSHLAPRMGTTRRRKPETS